MCVCVCLSVHVYLSLCVYVGGLNRDWIDMIAEGLDYSVHIPSFFMVGIDGLVLVCLLLRVSLQESHKLGFYEPQLANNKTKDHVQRE